MSEGKKPRKSKTPPGIWRKAFLSTLAQTGNVDLSARAAGTLHQTAQGARKRDPKFAEQWKDALAVAACRLEAEALRRAVHGYEEPVFGTLPATREVIETPDPKNPSRTIRKVVMRSQGTGQVGVIRRYSDDLLKMLLRGADREKYGVRPTATLNLTPADVEKMSDQELDELIARLDKRS